MLNQLDTLIGFAVVMTVVSLLITIITQMISSLLGLRGKNLADALGVMLYKIDPQFDRKFRQELAHYILTRPMISDSTMSMLTKWYDEVPVLRWFRSRWKFASAIRPEEIVDILKQVAGITPDEAEGRIKSLLANPDQLVAFLQESTEPAVPSKPPTPGSKKAVEAEKKAAAVQTLIKEVKDLVSAAGGAMTAASAAPLDLGLETAATQAKNAVLNAAAKVNSVKVGALRILAALHVTTDASKAAVAALTAQLPNLVTQTKAEAQALITQLSDASNIALQNLEKSFESAQDRAQQWFAMHTRLWTVLAAVVLAFALQLDTFRVFTQISSDSDLRGKLVNFSSDTLQKTADEVLTNSLSAGAINQEALRRLRSSTNFAGIGKLDAAPANVNLVNNSSVDDWLKAQAATNHWDETNVLDTFHSFGQMVAKENYNRAGNQFANLTSTFSKTGFQLMPDPYPPVFARNWRFFSWPWNWFSGEWSWPKRHLFGILTSAALLSLGAPFWFNLLKSMANLRPALANAIDKDAQGKAVKKQ